ncbi:MAG: hypothetical protein IJN21_08510 [Clostridia bacterium]|nr:hypothetical protein [Clostridia bacterium]
MDRILITLAHNVQAIVFFLNAKSEQMKIAKTIPRQQTEYETSQIMKDQLKLIGCMQGKK